MVMRRSRRDGSVLVDMTAGTVQPKPISGKTDFAQQLVHEEGDTGDVAGVLHQGQEEEQDDDNRKERKDGAYACENAVDDQAANSCACICGRESMVHNIGQGINAICHEVLQSGADDIEGQVEYEQHDENEAGNGGIFSREKPVNLL